MMVIGLCIIVSTYYTTTHSDLMIKTVICAVIVSALLHFSDAKRLIGRKFDDHVVQSDMKHWPFKVVSDGGKPKVEVEYKGEIKTFYPEEVSSMVLTKMKEISEAYLGKVRNKSVDVWGI